MDSDDTSGEEIEVIDGTGLVWNVFKVELTRQTVALVFGAAGTLITVYIARKLNDPDNWSMFKMWGALTMKRWAERQAERFNRLALHMATVYNGEKL